MFKSTRALLEKSREVDRGLGQYAERLSRLIWPWREHWLWLVVVSLAILDFATTYILLDVIEKQGVYESGRVAIWALQWGGFPFLLLVDLAAAMVLSILAFTARHLYSRRGFQGYGRAAFVFLLAPYIVFTAAAVVNNIFLLFR